MNRSDQLLNEDAPRIFLALMFIEGLFICIYTFYQLSFGGPYGAFLGLSLTRFLFLLLLVTFVFLIGLFLNHKSDKTNRVNQFISHFLSSRKTSNIVFLALGIITMIVGGYLYATFPSRQVHVLAVCTIYLGMLGVQLAILPRLIRLFNDQDSSHTLIAFSSTKRVRLLILFSVFIFLLSFSFQLYEHRQNLTQINLWAGIYAIYLLLVSFALGLWLTRLPNSLPIPAISRFWVGFCSAPFIIAVWMLGLVKFFPDIPAMILTYPLPILSIVVIFFWGSSGLKVLRQEMQERWVKSNNLLSINILLPGAALVLGSAMATLLLNGQLTIIDADALRYLTEALTIAQQRSLAALSLVYGSSQGLVYGDHHGFMFPAFLAHALLFNGHGIPGYPYDHAARLAFQILSMYMYLAILGLTSINKKTGTWLISILLLFQVPMLGVISYGSYRDPLRIISYLLLATVLAGFSPLRLRQKYNWRHSIMLIIISAFSISSHGSSLVVTPMIILAWLIWAAAGRTHWRKLLIVLCSTGVGCILGATHNIEIFLQTSSPWGVLTVPMAYLHDITPTVQRYYESYGNATGISLWEGWKILLARDRYWLSIPALAGIILSIGLWLRRREDEQVNLSFFTALLAMIILLPFSGLLDTVYYIWSKSYVYNYRYSLHWYPFAAVCVASFISTADQWFKIRWQQRLVDITIIVLLAWTAAYGNQVIRNEWMVQDANSVEREIFEKDITLHQEMISQIPVGKKLLIDDQIFNYYLNNQAILYLTPPTRDIAQAQNTNEVMAAMVKSNIAGAILYQSNFFDYYDRTALFDFLNQPQNAYVATENNDLRAYIVDSTLVKAHNQPIQAAQLLLVDALEYSQQGKTNESITSVEKAFNLFPGIVKTLSEDQRKSYLPVILNSIKQHAYLQQQETDLPQEEKSQWSLSGASIDHTQGTIAIWAQMVNQGQNSFELLAAEKGDGVKIYITSDNNIYYFYFYYEGQFAGRCLVRIPEPGFHHYVMVWQDRRQEIYIDGVRTLFADLPSTHKGMLSSSLMWIGELANLTIYDHALNMDEIYTLYQSIYD